MGRSDMFTLMCPCQTLQCLTICSVPCQVTEGSGAVLVVAVGDNSEWGKTMALVRTESADTPLQDSLGSLAAAIGKLGLAVGFLCFIVLTIRYRCCLHPVVMLLLSLPLL